MRYDRCITRNLPTGSAADGPDYDPLCPFKYIWWLATTEDPEGLAEKTWRRENFVDNAVLISDRAPVHAFIAGDAPNL